MSTYSRGSGPALDSTAGRLAGRVPVVEAVEPGGVVTDGAGEVSDGVDVVVVQVVVEDRGPHVGRRAVVHQVPRRGHYRVVGVVDVAALAPVGPRAGQELHRAQRPRRRRAVVTAE